MTYFIKNIVLNRKKIIFLLTVYQANNTLSKTTLLTTQKWIVNLIYCSNCQLIRYTNYISKNSNYKTEKNVSI